MNQMKRNLSNNGSLNEGTMISGVSTRKKRKAITSIEHLSNDLFYDIFEYFEGFDLYKAFSNLNTRFQDLLQWSTLRLKFYCPLETELQFHNRLKNVIFPNKNRILSLHTVGIRNNDTFFSPVTLDSSFTRLESLYLSKITSNTLLPVLRSLTTLPCLFSLTIVAPDHNVNNYDPYLMIFSLPVLKYIKLSLETAELPMESSANNNYQLSSLQYLIMDHSCTLSKFIAMTSSTPQLRHLSCRFLSGSNQSIENHMNITLTSLTHFSLYGCQLQFDQLEILIKKISSQLQVLRLTTSNDRAYFNGDRWKQLLAHYVPHLRLFEFEHEHEHQDIIGRFVEFTTDHALMRHFTSKFWTKPRWSIKLKFILGIWWNLRIVLSIDSYKEGWHQLNEFNKNSFNSNQPSQSVVLTISDRFTVSEYILDVDKLNQIFTVLQITDLIIECQNISIQGLIQILHLSPNLNSLKIQSLSLLKLESLSKTEVETRDLVSKKNNITKVNVEQINELSEVQFLIKLCPRMQYFQVGCSSKIYLKSFVKSILMQTTHIITELRTLCLSNKDLNDRMVKDLQDMINCEQLFRNYTIIYIDEKIYIQLE